MFQKSNNTRYANNSSFRTQQLIKQLKHDSILSMVEQLEKDVIENIVVIENIAENIVVENIVTQNVNKIEANVLRRNISRVKSVKW